MEPEQQFKPYAYYLQSEWAEIILLSVELRKQMIMALQNGQVEAGEVDETILVDFAARMTRLWLEIFPKVRGRDDFGKVKEEFLKFEQMCDPMKTLVGSDAGVSKESINKLFMMELAIRDALDALQITKW